jgi:hypothetical protein
MIETFRSSPEAADHVQVSRLCGKRERGRRQRSLAIEPGAAHSGAEKKMSDRFQACCKTSSQLSVLSKHGKQSVHTENWEPGTAPKSLNDADLNSYSRTLSLSCYECLDIVIDSSCTVKITAGIAFVD